MSDDKLICSSQPPDSTERSQGALLFPLDSASRDRY